MNAEIRRLIRQRAEDRCEYCRMWQSDEAWSRFHAEHIMAG
jgi:hypothetical protein